MKNSFQVNGDTTSIIINGKHGRHEVLIDTQSLEEVSKHSWHAGPAGVIRKTVYAVSGNQYKHSMHRLLLGFPKGAVDHINNNSLDNRLSNLRIVNASENAQNRSKEAVLSSSGIRNVTWNKSVGKWQVTVKVMGKSIYCGVYKDIKDAEVAAIAARKKYMECSTW